MHFPVLALVAQPGPDCPVCHGETTVAASLGDLEPQPGAELRCTSPAPWAGQLSVRRVESVILIETACTEV